MATDWVLIPCLVQLRTEFGQIAPGRDKASDGSIGDTAHKGTVSDHNADETGSVPVHDSDRVNEVHAIDVDADLRNTDLTMEKVVQFLLARCRSGAEKRLRYVIYNRRIWSASTGWVQRAYTGASPHTEHAHFSAQYDSASEASTASWHLEDIPVSLTKPDLAAIIDGVADEVMKRLRTQPGELLSDTEHAFIGDAVLTEHKIPGTNAPGNAYVRNADDILGDLFALMFFGHTKGGDPIPADGVFGQVLTKLAELTPTGPADEEEVPA